MKKLLLLSLFGFFGFQVANAQCAANFTFVVNGTNVTFTNTSTGFGNQSGWTWSFGDATTSTLQSPPVHTYPGPGTYTVCCGGVDFISQCYDSVCKTVTIIASSVNEVLLSESSVAVFPNPSMENASVSFNLTSKAMVSIGIYDVAGKLVSTVLNTELSNGSQKVDLDAANLNKGIYFVRLDVNGQVVVKKFTKL